MATQQHSTIVSADCHEPKYITDATTGDAGKVITPSSTSNGTSELRQLAESEITSVKDYYSVQIEDISTAGQKYIVVGATGTVTAVYSVINGALGTADVTLTPKIGGTAITNGVITVTQSGSAAGDVDSATPTANNSITAGQALEVETDGASTNTVEVVVTFEVTRS